MNVNASELDQYIGATLTTIRTAVENNGGKIVGFVKFDLAVSNTTEGKGGLKVHIVNAEGKISTETASKISFEVDPNYKNRTSQPINIPNYSYSRKRLGQNYR